MLFRPIDAKLMYLLWMVSISFELIPRFQNAILMFLLEDAKLPLF